MDQANFNFIESEKAYATRFFQFPQVLIYGSQYRTLSDSAKLGYMILHDRLDYSLRNNWVDEDNRVYFIFTNQELTDLMGWSKKKVIRVKSELEDKGLLFQRTMHFNPKTGKNEPNRLYLADLEVTATDVYIKRGSKQKVPQTLATSESVKWNLRGRPLKPLLRAKVSKWNLRESSLTTPRKPLSRAKVSKGVTIYIRLIT